ncbi:uncharacterized protein MELLADRAFT_60733 [Melampsora larici-populina 98AG31]|uniref:Uncharacterized protein n=1 Tax=Melampsora larici-populina (strain 98AG31 / pathotype 3-4-7) TaxID=747676 RepID=F4RC54_MELLP|nr:uncharacterized protein MELLADRAFT_60733 [Melampsora larici-populina 98AG31]EGG10220.1 hypothetical protein MELLADRAFT_60733 [Melampsora larici-populina 98AG31]
MDSEEFQTKIDEQIRNEEEETKGAEGSGEKGKGVEGGEGGETNEGLEEDSQENGQPPEVEEQVVGPIRIKRPKGKTNTNQQETPIIPPQLPPNPPTTSKTLLKQQIPPIQHDQPNKVGSEEESESEKEGGNLEVAGIYLDDFNHGAEKDGCADPIPAQPEDSVSQNLDAQTKLAFEQKNRVLYDKLLNDKRNWLEFLAKGKAGNKIKAVEKGGKDIIGEDEDMADIGIRNKAIKRRAERRTMMRNNELFLDNPYAYGQVKMNIDPINGVNWEGRTLAWDDPSRGKSKEVRNEVTKNTQSVHSALWAQARSKPHTAPQNHPYDYGRTPATYQTLPNHQIQATLTVFASTSAFPNYAQPPSQPASQWLGINPNYQGGPKNYIPNNQPNFRGGKGNYGNGNESGSNGNGGGNGIGVQKEREKKFSLYLVTNLVEEASNLMKYDE